MRVILASNHGTLMELGISPLITASMVLQFIKTSGMIAYDSYIKEDVRLGESLEKFCSFFVIFASSFGLVVSGIYGSLEYIGYYKGFALIIQLSFAGIMILYLDELLAKGYGIGNGVSLFIACNMCERIFWYAFSPVTMKSENGIEFEGAIIALFHFLITKPNKLSALYLAFYRQNVANLHNLIVTVLIFLLIIYLLHFRYALKLVNPRVKGTFTEYPIKLFYLSNMPMILQSTIVTNLHHTSRILYHRFRNYTWIRLLAVWQIDPRTGREHLIGGLSYYLQPPKGITGVMQDPFHFAIYFLIITASCGFFAKLWLSFSTQSPEDILRLIDSRKLRIANTSRNRGSMIKILRKYINTAATLGGVLIGVFSIISDLLGCIGSGTGLMLTVNIIYGYYEKFKDEGMEFNIGDHIER